MRSALCKRERGRTQGGLQGCREKRGGGDTMVRSHYHRTDSIERSTNSKKKGEREEGTEQGGGGDWLTHSLTRRN
jgi:hypothetical protein